MSLHSGVNVLLTSAPGVTALVGDRMYPQAAEQETPTPYLTWTVEGVQGTGHVAGPGTLARCTLKVQIWATLQADADAVADAVRQALDGVRGKYGATTIEILTWQGQQDFFEDNDQATERGYLGVEQTYKAVYRT